MFSNFSLNLYRVYEFSSWWHNLSNNFTIKYIYLVQSNQHQTQSKVNLFTTTEQSFLMEHIHGVFALTLADTDWLTILMIKSVDNLVLTLLKHIQNFLWICIIMLMKVIRMWIKQRLEGKEISTISYIDVNFLFSWKEAPAYWIFQDKISNLL